MYMPVEFKGELLYESDIDNQSKYFLRVILNNWIVANS